jgi:hypothetical protein
MSNRRTTRKEDIAYSLIGIFAVSMMIAYGEEEEAFFRLQREIMQNCDELEILLWEGRPSTHNSAIASGPICFANIQTDERRVDEEAQDEGNFNLDIPWGDRTFELTNAGLRINLPLYNMTGKLLDPKKEEQHAHYGDRIMKIQLSNSDLGHSIKWT